MITKTKTKTMLLTSNRLVENSGRFLGTLNTSVSHMLLKYGTPTYHHSDEICWTLTFDKTIRIDVYLRFDSNPTFDVLADCNKEIVFSVGGRGAEFEEMKEEILRTEGMINMYYVEYNRLGEYFNTKYFHDLYEYANFLSFDDKTITNKGIKQVDIRKVVCIGSYETLKDTIKIKVLK